MDHKAFLATLSTPTRERLTTRSNVRGLWRLTLHLGLIAVLGVVIWAEVTFWWLLILPQGILIAFLFTLEHEATHKTPFASERLNEAIGWFCGLAILQPFLWFRYFHYAHHRYTNDPDNDPELTGPPKPVDWPGFISYVASFGYWKNKAVLLWSNAFGQITAPFLPERVHAALRTESRRMLAVYAALLLLTIFVTPVLVYVWLLPLLAGFPFLRIYLLAEHGGCPMVANMFDNTRTVFTNPVMRLLAWNMPYHVEHHVFPQVPFHLLPEFHHELESHLVHTSSGYLNFTRDFVARFSD